MVPMASAGRQRGVGDASPPPAAWMLGQSGTSQSLSPHQYNGNQRSTSVTAQWPGVGRVHGSREERRREADMHPTFSSMTLPLPALPHGFHGSPHPQWRASLLFASCKELLCGTFCKGQRVDIGTKELLGRQPQRDNTSVLTIKATDTVEGKNSIT